MLKGSPSHTGGGINIRKEMVLLRDLNSVDILTETILFLKARKLTAQIKQISFLKDRNYPN